MLDFKGLKTQYILSALESRYTSNSHIWMHGCPHANVESNYQCRCSIFLRPGVTADQFIPPRSIWHSTGHICSFFGAKPTASSLTESFSTNTTSDVLPAWRPPHHSSHAGRHYLNKQFHNLWISRGGTINCPSRSPDLNLSCYRAKTTASAVNTTDTPLRRFIGAARRKNETEFPRKVTSSLVTRIIECIQTNGANCEQLPLSSAQRNSNCTGDNRYQ